MGERFSTEIYHHYLLNADVRGAAEYLRQFPEQSALAQQYDALFAEDRIEPTTGNTEVDAVLSAYTAYYREVFWVQMKPAAALINLQDRVRRIFPSAEPMELQALEDTVIAPAFEAAGFCFLGGRTGGYHGPYIWRSTETRTWRVELPESTCDYTVKLLSGFIHKSWLDYISFGALSTGGWVGEDGVICCVRESYDIEGENFRISLLKHEAQHAQDIARFPRIKPHELEYRAKLVELIYSEERDMLGQFLQQADPAIEASDHAYAAELVIQSLCGQLHCSRDVLQACDSACIREAAKRQLLTDSALMAAKYSR